ncbi:CPBP family intramembrane glutamic endopeptidase [Planococcus salinus]|uniref:CPBP family intramembrane metalloprotease n=1 Tax=Planococcus salinus TaxID=1848460 RepID=A0A3M8P662_9BACL|nr:type II CAAX endopeptidase family protein [Planococcus salinus]RNF38891.1 CPBP family intramembrane metalloprotease [Planococcus salinus]
MFEEMKIRHFLIWCFVGFVVAIVWFLQLPMDAYTGDLIVQVIMYIVVPGWFFAYHFQKQQVPLSRVVFAKGVKSWIAPMLGVVVLLILFSTGMMWLQMLALLQVAPWLVDLILEPVPLPDNTLYLVLTALILSVIGPIAEEFIFRGLLLKRLIRKTSMWGGVLISSILFGILHADIVGAFLFGVIASLLYLRTGNLLLPILLHVFNNTIAVLLMFVPPDQPQWLALTDSSDIYANALPFGLILLVSSLGMAWVVTRLVRGFQEDKKEQEDVVV